MMKDAVVVGSMLITLIRYAQRVRMACQAQLVNVIAPIMTVPGGPVWKQTIYYPYLHASRYGRGEAIDLRMNSATYRDKELGAIPYVDAIASREPESDNVTIFAINRSMDTSMDFRGDMRDFPGYAVREHLTLSHPDPEAVNSAEHPDNVIPRADGNARIDDGKLTATLAPLSWNVIRLVKG